MFSPLWSLALDAVALASSSLQKFSDGVSARVFDYLNPLHNFQHLLQP